MRPFNEWNFENIDIDENDDPRIIFGSIVFNLISSLSIKIR